MGQDGKSYGIKSDFTKYMPLLLQAFEGFEKDHPDASTLQAFRYQIAQAYWEHALMSEARAQSSQEYAQSLRELAQRWQSLDPTEAH